MVSQANFRIPSLDRPISFDELASPPVHRFDRQQAHGEVTETSGDEEKQNEPADDTSPRGLGLL